jgi:hypothetical protein
MAFSRRNPYVYKDIVMPKPAKPDNPIVCAKAHYILTCLLANRKLKSVCEKLDVSYKYVYHVLQNNQIPSMNLQKGLNSLIPFNYWFEESNESFKRLCKEEIHLFIARNGKK